MPYRGQWALIPAGQGGIVSDENPTRVLPSELVPASPAVGGTAIQTQGIVQQDGVWRREGGATSLDPTGLEDLAYKATLSLSVAWGLALRGYTLSTGASVATTHGSTIDDTLGTTHVHTIASADVPVGALLAVACTFYVLAGDTATVSVADTRANTWTLTGSSHSSASTIRVTLATTIVTTQLNIGDTVTFTRTSSGVSSTSVAASFTNATAVAPSTTQAGISAIVIGSLPPTGTYPLLTLAAVGNVGNPAVTLTQNTSYTEALREAGGLVTDTALCYRVYTGSPVTIYGLHHWRPTGTSTDWAILTATSNGKVYKSNSGGTVLDTNTLTTGLSATARPGKFIDCGQETAGADRHCVYVNGIDAPVVVSGTTSPAGALTAVAADWTPPTTSNQPRSGFVHRDRLFLFGNLNRPHHIYYSTIGDHLNFTGSGSGQIPLYPGVGDRLYAAAGYLGLAWFFKHPYGIFWLDDSDSDAANWKAQLLSDAVGCAPSPYAILPLGNDVMFLTADCRFMLLSTLREAGGVAHARALSSQLRLEKWMRETITLANLSQVTSVWYPHKRQAIWGLPANGSSSNTLLLTFDMEPTERDGMPVVTPSYRDTADALALFREADQVERPMLGQGPQVYLLDRTSRAKDGGGSTSFYCTQHLDLRHADLANAVRRKQFDQLIVRQNTNPSGAANTYTIYVFIDRVLRTTLTGSTATPRQRHLISGCGHEIALAVSQTEPTADFAIVEHLVGYVPTDEGAI